jgi:hypothetical protein
LISPRIEGAEKGRIAERPLLNNMHHYPTIQLMLNEKTSHPGKMAEGGKIVRKGRREPDAKVR